MIVTVSDDELVNMWGDDALTVMMMKMLSAIIIKQQALIVGKINGEGKVEGSSLTFS